MAARTGLVPRTRGVVSMRVVDAGDLPCKRRVGSVRHAGSISFPNHFPAHAGLSLGNSP